MKDKIINNKIWHIVLDENPVEKNNELISVIVQSKTMTIDT